VDEVLRVALRDRVFYDRSGGGVTFSGGEPLAQAGFLERCLRATGACSLHRAVDTSGCSREGLLAVAPHTDLFLYDLKPMPDDRHRDLVGLPFATVVGNLEALAAVHRTIWLRVPLIAGVTDGAADLAELRRLAVGLDAVRRVSLLPYHGTGAGKRPRVGRGYDRGRFTAPSAARVSAIARGLEEAGLEVTVGG
jgi:pyruvate formate lyase activating enzyme